MQQGLSLICKYTLEARPQDFSKSCLLADGGCGDGQESFKCACGCNSAGIGKCVDLLGVALLNIPRQPSPAGNTLTNTN
jgi:hypothetical protein